MTSTSGAALSQYGNSTSALGNAAATGANASGQSSGQPGQGSAPGLRPDRIGPGMEAIAPPLMPNMASNAAAADAFANAQGSGMAAVAVLAGVFAVGACFGIPIAFEAAGGRKWQKAKLKREELEHKLRDIYLSADEKTVEWVRALEKAEVNPRIVDILVAHMHANWNTYARAYKSAYERVETGADPELRDAALKRLHAAAEEAFKAQGRHFTAGTSDLASSRNTSGGASSQARRRAAHDAFVKEFFEKNAPKFYSEAAENDPSVREALVALEDNEIPLRRRSIMDARDQHAALPFSERLPLVPTEPTKKITLGPVAAQKVAHVYRDVLAGLKAEGKADNDNLRLLEQQSKSHLAREIGLPEYLADERIRGGRAKGRTLEFDEKSLSLHDSATAQFVKSVRP